MANADLARFRLKLREYRLLVNRNQSDLAAYLNLDYNELSNRLNSHKNARLSHDNVRAIVRALVDWGAITTTFQVEELLDLLLCPRFDQADLQARPLSKLVVSPTPTSPSNSRQNPFETPVTTPLQATSQPLLLNSPLAISHNLPQQFSSFIGRHKEVAELKKLLIQEKVRLISLVGAGGCGKTRLSLEVAAESLDSFREGVWFVELAPLSDPTLVAQTIATTLGLSEQAGRPIMDTLRDYLRTRHLLLVLDNCEHLLEECARVVDTLLHTCSNLQIMATSREAFGMNGEINYLVPSLTLPNAQWMPEVERLVSYEAVSLFIERAAAVSPHFSLSNLNAAAVVQLCRQLDGIPLAIELAAVRIKVLTVEQIAARLDDRFRLLTGGSRTALPRQQTLRSLVDWSYELLSEAEKKLLIRLSIFAGGWTLGAAQAVSGGEPGSEEYDILDTLTGLVNKSLVQVNEHKEYMQARYHFCFFTNRWLSS